MRSARSPLLILLIAFACLNLLLSLSPVTANTEQRRGRGRRHDDQRSSSCRRLRQLSVHEPSESESVRSEGGTFELYTGEDNEELDCAGVAFLRKTIESNAMSIPFYSGSPHLFYVVQGEGTVGIVFPGCPETFQGRSQRRRREEEEEEEEDSSQKVRRVRRGDVISMFAGAAYWWYNDGNEPLQIVAIADTSSDQNQLDKRRYRRFPLAGRGSPSPREEGEEEGRGIGGNIFAGFSTRTLAETLGVRLETARKLQRNQRSQLFVRVERGRRLSLPGHRSRSRSPSRYEREREWYHAAAGGLNESTHSPANGDGNGIEELVCPRSVKYNADNPEDADVYVRDGGRLNIVNRFKLPLLKYLRLGAERVILRPRAMYVPSWRMNAHDIMYVTRGQGRIEVVGDEGRNVFNGPVRAGQFIVIPQFHAVIKQAGDEGLEWITFTTSDIPVRSSLAGRESVLKAIPEEVVSAAFRIDRSEVREVMNNREDDTVILPPSSFRDHRKPRTHQVE